MKGRKPHEAAAQEALEEAGVSGRIAKRPIGSFAYVKRLRNGAPLACNVDVYPLQVRVQHDNWREQGQRTARWFTPDEAAEAVDEPELKAMILRFAEPAANGTAKLPSPAASDAPKAE